jgi:cysteine sulfinate desulfinase/cysteine desulfurase-like protein
MGVDPALAAGAIRLSLGWSSDEADIAHFGQAFGQIVARMRRAGQERGVTPRTI